jgi:purine-binding chemotaxis protein CheW
MDANTKTHGEDVPTMVPSAAEFLQTEGVSAQGDSIVETMDSLASRLILDGDVESELEEDADGPGRETIGTFFVSDTEFALAANSVREVVPYPTIVTQVPLTPDAFHGVFSLRGEVLPLLDAATLLAAEANVDREQRRVAIVDAADGHVGIAFDRTGEVLRINPNHRFGLCDKDGASTGVINGIIQLDDGARCIQELSASLIGSIPDVPYSKESSSRADRHVDQTVYEKVISVRVGSYELAFPMANLVEIQENLEMQAAPAYFEHCKGVIHLRGEIHTVMDFRAALGLPIGEGLTKFVFIQHKGATVALEVDSLVETIEYSDGSQLSLPQLPDTGIADLCDSVLPLEPDRHVLMVDVERIFERYQIAEGIGVLGPLGLAGEGKADVQEDEEERAVFTFQLAGRSLSLEMEDVLEVQRYPESVIESTERDGAVVGIMNLRGTVTPLIDLRKRFQLPPWEPSAEGGEEPPVVIVVEGTHSPYGLVVDKVDRIHRFFPSQARKVQTLLNQQSLGEGLLGYVKSALMLDSEESQDEASRFLLVVDTEKVTTT